jgi:hypothetical protein
MNMEYEDSKTPEELQIQTGEWVIGEATQLLQEYRKCQTEHEKSKMIAKLEYMRSKLAFEEKELVKLLKQNGYEQEEI